MSAERAYKTDGIVLRARNLGEADRIYTLFTVARGKVDAVGKGARRPKSQLAGRLEFASLASLSLHRGRSLDVIVGAEILRSHWNAVVEPSAFAAASLFVELVDAFCELDLALPEVYVLLARALEALERSTEPLALVPRFQLRLLEALGYGPGADDCVRCGRSLEGEAAWADLDAGGLACEACRPHRSDRFALEREDAANFRALGAARVRGAGAALIATPAAARAIDAFVSYHLGKRPKAGKLLDDVQYLASLARDPA